jgi:hypothetical protein
MTRGARATPIAVDRGLKLPFSDATIDLVVVSLGRSWPSGSQAQRKLVSELRRVLSPHGEMLLILRSGAAQGRVAARRLWHAWTTRRSLDDVLERNGFESVEWFMPLRSGEGCLTEIRPVRPRSGLWRGYDPLRLAGRMRHSHWFATDLVVRAATGKLEPSALQRCLESSSSDAAGHARKTHRISVERLLVTPKEKVVGLVDINGVPSVIRIPLTRSALEGCRNNIAALRALRLSSVDLAPMPLGEGHAGSYYFALESRIDGQPMRKAPRAQSDLALIESLMKRLNPDAEPRVLDGPTYDRLISTPLRRVAAFAASAGHRETLETFFSSGLRGRQVSIGVSHGDLSISNVYLKGNDLSGLIDWDDSRMDGLPILDAISHLCSRQFKRSANFAETFSKLATRQWPEPDELSFLDRCYEYFATDASCHSALVFSYWLGVVDRHLDFWYARDPGFLQSRVRAVIDTIVDDHVRHAAFA